MPRDPGSFDGYPHGMPRQIAAIAAAVGALVAGLLWWRNRDVELPDRFGSWKPVE